jgi:hypothetical protein
VGCVDPFRFDDQGHGGQSQLLNLVNTWADNGPTAHNHGWRTVEHSGYNDGLIGTASHHTDIQTHVLDEQFQIQISQNTLLIVVVIMVFLIEKVLIFLISFSGFTGSSKKITENFCTKSNLNQIQTLDQIVSYMKPSLIFLFNLSLLF